MRVGHTTWKGSEEMTKGQGRQECWVVTEGGRCPGKFLFRSPSNPPVALGGAPCEGDRQELQACYTACGTGTRRQETAFLFPILCPGWYLGWPVSEAVPDETGVPVPLSCLAPNTDRNRDVRCGRRDVARKWE